MSAKRLFLLCAWGFFLALLAGAALAAGPSAGASPRNLSAVAPAGRAVHSLDFEIGASVPLTTPTPPRGTPTLTTTPTRLPTSMPNLWPGMQWVSTCLTQSLQLTTHSNSIPSIRSIGSSHMRLSDSAGDYRDFAVPSFTHQYYESYTYDCQVGSCLPQPWLSSLPLTLTVDIFNEVIEFNEEDNTMAMNDLPPPCQTSTPTASATNTPTMSPSATPTETPTGSTSTPTGTPTPCAASFTDVHPSDYFYQAVNWLYCHGAISGYADGTFRPYNNVTRGQVCKIVVIAFDFPIDTTGGPHFIDVPPSNPFYPYIETLYNRHIVSGYADGTFRPYNYLTRAQLVKIVCLASGWELIDPPTPTFTDVPPGSPFYTYIETAYCHQVIGGYSDGTFRSGNYVTRGQTAKIVYGAVMGYPPCGTPTPTTTPGP